MTKIEAINTLNLSWPGYCVVRWATRFLKPAWTVESINYAERMVAEYGVDYCRIEKRNQ